MKNKQPIGADCVCDLGSEKHYHPQCEYYMVKKDWREQSYPKKLIVLKTTKKEWKQYSLWGRFGIRVGQIIGLIEINFYDLH